MRIEIITIGDELLLGYTIDTNGAHLAREPDVLREIRRIGEAVGLVRRPESVQ